MNRNLYGFDAGYRTARDKAFYGMPKSRIPLTIVCHRRVIPARKRDS